MKLLKLRSDLRIALLYTLFGGIWILISDRILGMFITDTSTLTTVQTYKGWVFVAFSAILIFSLLRLEAVHRKNAEKKSQESEDQFHLLLENLMDAVLIGTPKGDLLASNPAACQLFGYSNEDFRHLDWKELVDLNDPRLDAALKDHNNTGRFRGELTCLHKDGTRFEADISTVLFKQANGDVRISLIIRDVTQRKQFEEEILKSYTELEYRVQERTADLSHLNAELERASQTKDEFLANMSHELRTPLTGILGMAESLRLHTQGPLNEKQNLMLKSIETSGKHLLNLINDILDLSKINAGKFDLKPELCNVEEICLSSMTFIREQAYKKNISLEYQQASEAKTLLADPQRLKQILVNLLSNAVKFTPEHRKINLSVTTDQKRSQISFSVMDSGIGIAQKDIQQLFKPFTQLDAGLNRQFEGTGLGLSLVVQLTEMHGGSVHVESEVGQGSCFTISLPWHHQSEPKTEPLPAGSSTAAKKQHGTVLLAEDNETNVEAFSDYLMYRGYTIIVAYNGLDALAKTEEHRPQLIIMDIQMPVMDGLEAIRRLRADSRFTSLPIIALTALAMPGDRERCLEAGATDYLSKPISPRLLAGRIAELMEDNK